MHFIKNIFKIAFLIGILGVSASQTYAQTQPTEEYSNSIAAVVDGKVITLHELQMKIIPFIPQLRRESKSQAELNEKIETTGRQILENMIDEHLMIYEYKSNEKFQIPQPYLENNYAKFIEEQFQGDRSKYIAFLKAQGLTDREFREKQKDDVILAYARSEMRKSQAEISPDKIEKYYKEHADLFKQPEGVLLRQITLMPLPGDDEESSQLLDKANHLISELEKGKSFDELARKYSEDDMKSSGGNWGWINRDDIRKELADVAFSLKKGEHSEPILLSNHAFILFVEDKREDGVKPLKEVRALIEKVISDELSKKAQADHIQKLRKKAFIKYYI